MCYNAFGLLKSGAQTGENTIPQQAKNAIFI
jgi:hypothetical protein